MSVHESGQGTGTSTKNSISFPFLCADDGERMNEMKHKILILEVAFWRSKILFLLLFSAVVEHFFDGYFLYLLFFMPRTSPSFAFFFAINMHRHLKFSFSFFFPYNFSFVFHN
jgi:hypothetical protein